MRKRHGMTLVELMVGITIATLAVAAGYAAFSSIIDHNRRVNEETDEVMRASSIRQTLVRWISGSQVSIVDNVPSNDMSMGFNASNDNVLFATSALTQLSGTRTRINLFIDDDPSTPESGLTARIKAWVGDDSVSMQIDSTITQFTVDFLTRVDNGRKWVPSREAQDFNPIAVRLTFGSNSGVLHPLLSVPLVVPIGLLGVGGGS